MDRISIKDIAQLSDSSISTVSRVLNDNGYVSAEKREQIERIIRETKYRPNTIARSLASKHSKIIGVCIPFLNSPFFASIMRGVEEKNKEYGYDVFICHTEETTSVEKATIERLIDRRVDGILIAPVDRESTTLPTLLRGSPTVYVIRACKNMQAPGVFLDDRTASITIFKHLLDMGHRKIGIVKGPGNVSSVENRWEGVQWILKQYGLELEQKYVQETKLTQAESCKACNRLLDMDDPPTAIYSTHYWGTMGVCQAIMEKGLKIPQDISVASFESSHEWNMFMPLQMTANNFPAMEMGRTAMEMLHNVIIGKKNETENVLLGMEFIDRSSVRNLLQPH